MLGRKLDYRVQTGSTMDDARELAASGAAHGTLVLAEEQISGRGRRGRPFHSPAGENLYFTFVLRVALEALRRAPIAVPLAVCQACRDAGVDALLKWPNDVWIGDRKVCGMLIDSEIAPAGALLFPGIGLNVNGDPRQIPGLADIATSLRIEAGATIDRETLLADICNHLERYLHSATDDLVAAYRKVSMILGRPVTVTEAGSATYEAVAVELTGDGSLVVEIGDGERRTVTAGEVSIRPA